jgi:hypothetical protein
LNLRYLALTLQNYIGSPVRHNFPTPRIGVTSLKMVVENAGVKPSIIISLSSHILA